MGRGEEEAGHEARGGGECTPVAHSRPPPLALLRSCHAYTNLQSGGLSSGTPQQEQCKHNASTTQAPRGG